MRLEFNAIIPLETWEWEEGKSSVYMRFGVKELGNWKLNIGPGEIVRYIILDYLKFISMLTEMLVKGYMLSNFLWKWTMSLSNQRYTLVFLTNI